MLPVDAVNEINEDSEALKNQMPSAVTQMTSFRTVVIKLAMLFQALKLSSKNPAGDPAGACRLIHSKSLETSRPRIQRTP